MLQFNNAKHQQLEEELANVNRLHFHSLELENAYGRDFIDSNLFRHRLSCIVGVVVVLVFMLLDLPNFPEESKTPYLLIRGGICIPLFVVSFLVSKVPSMRTQVPFWLVTSLLVVGLGSVVILVINYSYGHISPYEGILLTIIACYFLVGLDFRSATLCSGLIFISYLYSAIFYYDDDYNTIFYNLAFVGSTLMICSVGGYSVEKQLRINFLNNEMLRMLSQHDSLTGIYNRAALEVKLTQAVLSAKRYKQGVAIALVDIDHFKSYNDNYGHIAGDRCIQEVAMALQDCCKRSHDFCARYGGEEFAIVWEPANNLAPETMAASIQTSIEKLDIIHEFSNGLGKVTVSGGVYYFEPHILNPKETLENKEIFSVVDSALYKAKNAGRNRIEVIRHALQTTEVDPNKSPLH